MAVDPLLKQARGVWETLAALLASIPLSEGLPVVMSPASQLAPPSWTGIVVLGDPVIVTTPTEDCAGLASVPGQDAPA